MLGVLANTAAVIIGSLIGLLFKKGINKRITDGIMCAVALSVMYIGITGALSGKNTLVLVISMAIGSLIGSAIDIDRRFTAFANRIESKFKKTDGSVNFAEGFIAASLLFCIGAMTVVGSLQAGLTGDISTLLVKSILDFISSIIFASTFGIGVIFSSAVVFTVQGGIALVANLLAPLLSDAVIAEMTCAGSLLIVALSLNMLGITKLKIANFLPAVILPIIICPLYDWISSLLASLI